MENLSLCYLCLYLIIQHICVATISKQRPVCASKLDTCPDHSVLTLAAQWYKDINMLRDTILQWIQTAVEVMMSGAECPIWTADTS